MSDFTDMLYGAGQSALAGGIGGALGLMLQGAQNNMQLDQQKAMNQINMQYQQDMSRFNYGQQMQMWKDTNYGAQVDQLNKAGLNPGLIYQKGGPGGMTATNPAPSPGSQAQPQTGGTAMGIQMMNMQLMEAQKRNIDADTANKEAQTANAPLTGQNIQASTASLTQGVENQKAVEALTKIQTQLANFDAEIKGKTLTQTISMAEGQLRLLGAQVTNADNEALVSTNTWSSKIELAQQQVIQMVAQNELIRTQTGQAQAQTQNIANQIAQAWGQLKNEQDRTKIQQAQMDFNTKFGNQAGQILGTLLHLIPK